MSLSPCELIEQCRTYATGILEKGMDIIIAQTDEQLAEARRLFREYAEDLGVDLCFQGFAEELAHLPEKYGPPHGALLLAVEDEQTIGCVALRKLQDRVCEMKRLYVKPRFRGKGIGRALAAAIIEKAIALGYSTMRLDTLENLKEAVNLYASLGFKESRPYYDNPLPNVVYWELDLKIKPG